MGFWDFFKRKKGDAPKHDSVASAIDFKNEDIFMHDGYSLKDGLDEIEANFDFDVDHATEQNTETAEQVKELDPVPSQMAPFMVEMLKGQTYKLCRCGQSAKHPFCDGSHEEAECQHKPYEFKPKRSGYHSICGCMESYSYPICDGTHDLLL